MKPFQRLLLAPVAMGLLAPMAATASDLNLGDINKYAGKSNKADQVTSINQFSDVQPTAWAYQALSNLIERYGCVAGYPNGTFKGGQAITRWEAAALLNACLDRVTEITDELKKLMEEFEKELALLRGRVDGLEARVGELEATQFSTTTKLKGDAYFVIGANSFGGSQDSAFKGTDDRPLPTTAIREGNKYPSNNRKTSGATVFNYDVRLNLETSFTGKDLLYTRLRAGNFLNSPFSGNPYNLMALDRAFPSSRTPAYDNNDVVQIDRLYYRFPIGTSFTALLGAKARNTEFVGINPWFYNPGNLDFFTLNGAPGTYNKATGGGFGLMWKQNVKKGKPYFAISSNYIAVNSDNGDPSKGGLFTDGSRGNILTQIGVASSQWAITGAWRYGQCNQNFRRGTQYANQTQTCGSGSDDNKINSNNYAITAAWQPAKSSWIPSINLGWGYNDLNQGNKVSTLENAGIDPYYSAGNISASQSWSAAIQWSDVFMKGNQLGMAVGQPVFATKLENGATPNDGNYAWEWWYKFQVTDNISVTPTLYYLSRPGGQYTAPGETSDVFGGFVSTRFRF